MTEFHYLVMYVGVKSHTNPAKMAKQEPLLDMAASAHPQSPMDGSSGRTWKTGSGDLGQTEIQEEKKWDYLGKRACDLV